MCWSNIAIYHVDILKPILALFIYIIAFFPGANIYQARYPVFQNQFLLHVSPVIKIKDVDARYLGQ